jgi:hypothetical protein
MKNPQQTYRIRQDLKRRFSTYSEKAQVFAGFLGDAQGRIAVPGKENYVYVRTVNGELYPLGVFNDVVNLTWNMPVWVGYSAYNRSNLRIVAPRDVFDTPTASGVREHGKTHEYGGSDQVNVWASAFMPWKIVPVGGLLINIYAVPYQFDSAYYVPPKAVTLNLTAHLPATSGSRWCLVCVGSDVTGAYFTLVDGDIQPSKQALTYAYIPAAAPNTFPIAAICLSHGQTSILVNQITNDILDLRFARMNGAGGGGGDNTIIIKEVDGTPAVTAGILKFPNGTLTDEGAGVVVYTPAVSPAQVTVGEFEGTQVENVESLQFENAIVEDLGANVAKITISSTPVSPSFLYENLTPQIDGITATFVTASEIQGASLRLFYNGLKVSAADITLGLDLMSFTLDFVPVVGDQLEAEYNDTALASRGNVAAMPKVLQVKTPDAPGSYQNFHLYLPGSPALGSLLVLGLNLLNRDSTAVASTGTTWTKLTAHTSAGSAHYELWVGKVTTTGASNDIYITTPSNDWVSAAALEVAEPIGSPAAGMTAYAEANGLGSASGPYVPNFNGNLIAWMGGIDNTSSAAYFTPTAPWNGGCVGAGVTVGVLYGPANGFWINTSCPTTNRTVLLVAEVV